MRSWIRGLACRALAALAFVVPLPVLAQALVMVVSNASIFEGNSGSRVLSFPVNFIGGAPAATVTGFVSAQPLSGNGFTPTTGGAACGAAGVDFESFSNVPFTIPAGTPNGTLTVGVRICSDAVIEPNEHIVVSLTNVAGGGLCTSESCTAIGTIQNDDGTPSLTINDVTVTQPLLGNKTATFTVRLSHPVTQTVGVSFATRDGTATGGPASCFPQLACPGDYATRSGALQFDPGVLEQTLGITIRSGGTNEPDETFFVDLTAPVNATISDASGRGTIKSGSPITGGFAFEADEAPALPGQTRVVALEWTVPDPLVWRQLRSIDLRIREDKTFWLRWDEASNRLALCRHGRAPGGNDAPLQSGITCGDGALPGEAGILAGDLAALHLLGTRVVGSGPTGPTVRLELPFAFSPRAAGRTLTFEVAAADDFGNEDRFVPAGEVNVQRGDRR